MSADKQSPALRYLTAALQALPKSMGDRERANVIHRFMILAIETCMEFGQNDHVDLEKAPLRGAGLLDARWYHLACANGGTYARMWESFTGMAPWKAPFVLPDRGRAALKNNRMAPGLAIILPSGWADGMHHTDCQTSRGGEVWWCTSVDQDNITMCRYKGRDALFPMKPHRGAPIKRKKISRTRWEAVRFLAKGPKDQDSAG